jgi:membrane-associated phospholipid phosphatase
MKIRISTKANCLIKFLFITSFLYAQNLDINILRDINLHRNKSWDGTFKNITNSVSPVSLATPIIVYAVGLINGDKDLKEKGIFIGETFLVSAFITTALKYIVKRDRPFKSYPEIEKLTLGGSYSFPSGHSSDAFATATSLSMVFPKWYVITSSFLWASAVGYSRMDLGVHYPSDVVAGALIGIGSAFLTCKLNKWINKKGRKTKLYDGKIKSNRTELTFVLNKNI